MKLASKTQEMNTLLIKSGISFHMNDEAFKEKKGRRPLYVPWSTDNTNFLSFDWWLQFLHFAPTTTSSQKKIGAANHSLWLIRLWVFVSTILSSQIFTPVETAEQENITHRDRERRGNDATQHQHPRVSFTPWPDVRIWAAPIPIIWFSYLMLPLPAPVAPRAQPHTQALKNRRSTTT